MVWRATNDVSAYMRADQTGRIAAAAWVRGRARADDVGSGLGGASASRKHAEIAAPTAAPLPRLSHQATPRRSLTSCRSCRPLSLPAHVHTYPCPCPSLPLRRPSPSQPASPVAGRDAMLIVMMMLADDAVPRRLPHHSTHPLTTHHSPLTSHHSPSPTHSPLPPQLHPLIVYLLQPTDKVFAQSVPDCRSAAAAISFAGSAAPWAHQVSPAAGPCRLLCVLLAPLRPPLTPRPAHTLASPLHSTTPPHALHPNHPPSLTSYKPTSLRDSYRNRVTVPAPPSLSCSLPSTRSRRLLAAPSPLLRSPTIPLPPSLPRPPWVGRSAKAHPPFTTRGTRDPVPATRKRLV